MQTSSHRAIKPVIFKKLPAAVLAILLTVFFVGPLQAQEKAIESLRETGKAFASVAKKVSPAVVFIRVEKEVSAQQMPQFPAPFGDDFFRRFFGQPLPKGHPRPFQPAPKRRQMGQGSGFIVTSDGYLLTNNHVVADADKVTVTLVDGRKFTAKIVGTDPRSDVAVIKIDAKNLPVLPLGDSDKLQVGEWVIAVGNPFGLSHTITAGIVSAKGRSSVGISDYENFIQTDAAINPGNSGGPLVNLDGQAVGMNTAIFSRSGGYMGIGFAIPINMIKVIFDQLVKTGHVTRGYLGIMIQDLTPELAKSFDLKDNQGVLVAQVTKDSPAEKAGLKQGDVIIEFAGQPVKKIGPFRNRVALKAPGSKQTIVVLRDGKRKELAVTIGKLPDKGGSKTAKSGPAAEKLEKLGLTVQKLTPELAKQFGYKGRSGVLVSEVQPDSPAANAGIRRGVLIEEINRQPVKSVDEFERIVAKAHKNGTILLLVREGEYSHYVALSLD
jgi:serine protease Do